MDTRKLIIASASMVLLGIALWGTATWIEHRGLRCGNHCEYSTVAALAMKDILNSEVKATVQALDQSFTNEYTQVCATLCRQREQLSQRLGSAKADDPESQALLEKITASQTQLEILTWKHIMDVRDSLPEAKRAAFVKAVQNQWGQGMARMKHQVNECTMHKGTQEQF
jgi:hypothetical protein